MPVAVRRRQPEDVPVVGALIMRQQPMTRYPFRNPLPFPVEQFVQRDGELAAWVAVATATATATASAGSTAERVVGHVSVLDVTEHEIGPRWSAAVGHPVVDLAAVSVLVVDHDHTGHGIGSLLMDTCEAYLREIGRHPVLEVVGGAHGRAVSLYLARGWQIIGDVKPHWLPDGEGPVHIMALPDR